VFTNQNVHYLHALQATKCYEMYRRNAELVYNHGLIDNGALGLGLFQVFAEWKVTLPAGGRKY
jgi:hypothetical protein